MRARAFALLAAEAMRDAVRSRAGLGVALGAVLCLVVVNRCTGLELVANGMDGEGLDPAALARVLGPVLYGMVALFLVAATGLVAVDSLARPIEDGTVSLWLARPVGRTPYALARLAGTMGLAGGAGVAVLLAATVLLEMRHGLSLAPGAFGTLVFLLEALVVSSLAMAASLFLPRLLTLFVILLWVQAAVFANTAHMLGAKLGGWLGAMERFGPPLGTALLFAVSPWVGLDPRTEQAVWIFGRLALWAAAGVALVAFAFRRMELR